MPTFHGAMPDGIASSERGSLSLATLAMTRQRQHGEHERLPWVVDVVLTWVLFVACRVVDAAARFLRWMQQVRHG